MDAAQTELWRQVLEAKKQRLRSAKRQRVLENLNYDSFEQTLQTLTAGFSQRKLTTFLSSINPAVEHVRAFSTVIGTIVSSNPQIAALVWGSFSILLEVRATE
jgi:hypothetical protein